MAVLDTNERVTALLIALVEKAVVCCFPAVRRKAEMAASFIVEEPTTNEVWMEVGGR